MARNYVALPYDYDDEMQELNDEEFGRLIRALLKYSMTGEQIALSGNERFYAKRVMSQEDRFQESYIETSDKRREAGKKGAAKRWDSKNGNAILPLANDSKNGNTETKTNTETNNQLSNDSRLSEEKPPRTRFVPPTVDQVAEYVKQRGSNVDPQGFIDFYASKGWLVGKTPMKDWKAACRNAESWERWEKKPDKNAPEVKYKDFGGCRDVNDQMRKDMEELDKFMRGGT